MNTYPPHADTCKLNQTLDINSKLKKNTCPSQTAKKFLTITAFFFSNNLIKEAYNSFQYWKLKTVLSLFTWITNTMKNFQFKRYF